jgi:hypothetical protein
MKHEMKFREGESRTEKAIKAIENALSVLEKEGKRQKYISENAPNPIASFQSEILGENYLRAVDDIKNRLNLLKQNVEEILSQTY